MAITLELYNLVSAAFFRKTLLVVMYDFFHKLSEKHIHPSTWEKINVKLAAQLMSETVGERNSENIVVGVNCNFCFTQ